MKNTYRGIEEEDFVDDAPDPSVHTRGERKFLLLAVFALLAVVVASAVFVYARYGIWASGDGDDAGMNKYITPETGITPVYDGEKEETLFLYGASVLSGKVPGETDHVYTSADGDQAVVLTKDGELYHVSEEGVSLIGNEAVSAGIAFSGKRAYYVDKYNTLWNVDLGDGSAAAAGEDIAPEYGIAVSPDGKRMMYCAETENGVVLYAYRNRRAEIFARDFYPFSISDGGRYIYLRRGDGELYGARLGSDEKTLLSSSVDFSTCTLNADGSEIIYMSGGDGYIALDCKTTRRLCGMTSFSVLLPEGGVSGKYQPVTTFLNTPICYSDDKSELSVGFLDADAGFCVTAKSVDAVSTNEAGTFVCFLSDGDLYKAPLAYGEEPTLIAENVTSFELSRSGEYVYCISCTGSDLCRVGTAEGETVTVAYGVDGFDVVGEGVLYVRNGGSGNDGLFLCDDGETSVKIKDGSFRIETVPSSDLSVFVDGNGDFYISTDGRELGRVEF